MLPFLKRRDDGVGVGPTEQKQMKTVEGDEDFEPLSEIAKDMMLAFDSKDEKLMKSALEALCEYIRAEDIEQDLGE